MTTNKIMKYLYFISHKNSTINNMHVNSKKGNNKQRMTDITRLHHIISLLYCQGVIFRNSVWGSYKTYARKQNKQTNVSSDTSSRTELEKLFQPVNQSI